MSAGEIAFLATTLFGGLALFIFGMQLMTTGLQALAGSRMRGLLNGLTGNRFSGFIAGSGVGLLIHSSAGTVMLVGFVNAGLLSLSASVPIMLGTNVGTTLSMQLISFKLSKYAFGAIAFGLATRVLSKRVSLQNLGLMVFGFGLLFLGMNTMGGAIVPLKEAGIFEPLLAHADAGTAGGLILGILIAAVVTGVIQSSGATIGMLFALSAAGVFSDLSNVFPLVLGAHVGTCATALLGCIGTGIQARRTALAHLLFNLLGAVLAAVMSPLYLDWVPRLGGDLTRQIANTHTMVQLVNALIVLAVVPLFVRLVVRVSPSRSAPEQSSHLEETLLPTPEAALAAVIRETSRMTEIVRFMMRRAMKGLFHQTEEPFARVERDEEAVDLIKETVSDYLVQISRRELSRRQAVLLQHLMRITSDIERMGDHAESLIAMTQDKKAHAVWFADESMALLSELYQAADEVLAQMVTSLDPGAPEFDDAARKVLETSAGYVKLTAHLREHSNSRLMQALDDPFTALVYIRFVTALDKIVHHAAAAVHAELEEQFRIKDRKLDRVAEEAPERPAITGRGLQVDDSIFQTGDDVDKPTQDD